MKTVCLLPVATDARIDRRLNALESRGVVTDILAFERDHHPGRPPASGFQSLGTVSHGHYVGRLPALLRAARVVRAAVANADVVYAFSLDLHALAWIVTRTMRRRPSLVYEVADIHSTLVGTGLAARLMRAVERRLLTDTRLVVVTSEAFVTGFYLGVQKISSLPHLLVENKPVIGQVAGGTAARPCQAGPITIGYFGMIRCRRSWQTLRTIAERGNGRVRVYIRGVPFGLPDFEREAAASAWIEYGGPYVAPDDLAEMYGRIDCSWTAHHVDDNNTVLWNRTNRFYEACAFHTPMVAQVQTQDGDVVAARQLGPCIDLLDIEACVTRVLAVTWDELVQWRTHMESLPRSVYTEDGEHDELARLILRLGHAA